NSEPEEFSKKCYMEESVSRSPLKNKSRVLSNLRKARNILQIFPVMSRFISWYYNSGSLLKKIAAEIPLFQKYSLDVATMIDYLFEMRPIQISSFIAALKP
ncbi:MAG: hypothetical protein KAR14_04990, partial [Candidatus Aminicenantes bacterium]|nr:hypothetical protein [Candidatus Aminicenantes bacterium]